MTRVVVADLDGTLCVSHRRAAPSPDLIPVDVWDNGSAVTTLAGRSAWSALSDSGALLPATARSPAQFRRMQWPGPSPRFVILLNGSLILQDGVEVQSWTRAVAQAARTIGWRRQGANAALVRILPRSKIVDTGHALFAAAVCAEEPDAESRLRLASRATSAGEIASIQGRKVFLAPDGFGKWNALRWLVGRHGLEVVGAAGDSALDVELLRAAPRAACPQGSEASGCMPGAAVYRPNGPPAAQTEAIARWLQDLAVG